MIPKEFFVTSGKAISPVSEVPDTKPSDRVRVKTTRISQRFAEAEVVGVTAEE